MTGESRRHGRSAPWPYRLCLIVAAGVSALVANRLAFTFFDGVPHGKRVRAEALDATRSEPIPVTSVALPEAAARHGAHRPERGATVPTSPLSRDADEAAPGHNEGSGSDDPPVPPVTKSPTSTELVINEAYRAAPLLTSDSKEGESEAESLARKSAHRQDAAVVWQHDGKPVARGLRLLANDAGWKREPAPLAKDEVAQMPEAKK